MFEVEDSRTGQTLIYFVYESMCPADIVEAAYWGL